MRFGERGFWYLALGFWLLVFELGVLNFEFSRNTEAPEQPVQNQKPKAKNQTDVFQGLALLPREHCRTRCAKEDTQNDGRVRQQHREPGARPVDVFGEVDHARWEID